MKVLFVGCYTTTQPHVTGAGEGIRSFVLTTENSKPCLTEIGTTFAGEDPSYVAITNNKQFLYSVSDSPLGENASVWAFRIRDSGRKLEKIGHYSTRGIGPCFVSVDKDDKFVFVSNYSSGSVHSYRIQEDGSLVPDKFHQFTGNSGVVPDRQEAPHAHCFVPDLEGKFVYCADLGDDKVWIFKINRGRGQEVFEPFKDQPFVSTPPGSGPRHISFHPNNRFVYVCNELGNTVLFFEKNENGILTQKQVLPTLPDSTEKPRHAADIHCTDDGRFLYVSNRDIENKSRDTLAIFGIDQSSGNLSKIGHESAGGMVPRNFTIDREFLFVANQNSHDIVPYKINQTSGKLEYCGEKFESPSPVCLKIVDFQ